MQSIKGRYYLLIVIGVLSFMLIGCSHLIPVYERIDGDSVIKEKEIGMYDDKENSLKINSDYSLDDEALTKTVSLFKKSTIYSVENSKIEKLVLYPDAVTVRVQLKNDRYFVVRKNTDDNDLTLVESGIVGRAR